MIVVASAHPGTVPVVVPAVLVVVLLLAVRYVEKRDGHNWENWRDRLQDGLSWLFPGRQKFVYE